MTHRERNAINHPAQAAGSQPADLIELPDPTAEPDAVPVLVVSASPDNAEAINSVLRNRGIPAHCKRITSAMDFHDEVRGDYHLAVVFADEDDRLLTEILRVRDLEDTEIPVISCRKTMDAEQLSADVVAGAADLVVLSQRQRLYKVLEREIRRARIGRALREAIAVAASYREQLKTFMAGSTDALAHVQEGIVIDINPAWGQLFGYEDESEMVGLPIMDLFAAVSQATIKGALVACMQGRWPGDKLRCKGTDRNGEDLDLELELEPGEFEQEPCVRINIASGARDDAQLLKDLRDAVRKDPLTGFFSRQYFVEQLQSAVDAPLSGGVRALAIIRPDTFGRVVETVGPIASEDLLARMARILHEHLQPKDIYGRFGGTAFAIVLARGNNRDLRAWSGALCRKLAAQLFEVEGKSIAMTCTVGLAIADNDRKSVDELIRQAVEACGVGRIQGGNRVQQSNADDASTRIEESDRLWVPRIKQALIENRFRLARQPIASLTGDDSGLVDILVRMIDEQGDEVLPSEFMAAAERNQLIKNIDRWVIGASLAWLADSDAQRAFLRLSRPSIMDDMLLQWLADRLRDSGIEPSRVVFQVAETAAEAQLKATRDLATRLRSAGFGFAIEHFGVGARPAQIISHVPMDFLKIDGSFMQGLAGDRDLQNKVTDLVSEAKNHQILTIAERVEDANTMAVLWQVGVEYIQGYQVMEPEVVLAEEPHN